VLTAAVSYIALCEVGSNVEVSERAQEEDLKQAMLITQAIFAQVTYKINPT